MKDWNFKNNSFKISQGIIEKTIFKTIIIDKKDIFHGHILKTYAKSADVFFFIFFWILQISLVLITHH
jgi:hypothetical protein